MSNYDNIKSSNSPSGWKSISEIPVNVYKAYIKDVEDAELEEKYSYRKRMNMPLDDDTSKESLKLNRKKLREKYVSYGLDSFDECEVLELILSYTLPCQDNHDIARRLIMSFGSLKAVLKADYESLLEFDDISDVTASHLVLYRDLGKYINTKDYGDIYLPTSEFAGRFCCEYFKNHVEESFILITLGPNDVIVSLDVISSGTESETSFHTRRILKRVLQHRSTRVLMAHNHPMDVCKPSTDDITATSAIYQILDCIGVTLVDHIVCSGDNYFSMSDKGAFGTGNG